MERLFLGLAGLSGAIAVALGAFGAHALRARLASDQLSTFTTGVQYQMYHALALGIVGLALAKPIGSATLLATAGWLFVLGTIVFSGSLYGLVLIRIRRLGAITPLGGLAFIAGWILLALAMLQG